MFQMNTVEIFSWIINTFAQTLKVSLHPEKRKTQHDMISTLIIIIQHWASAEDE
jgi:hypothetical protein